MAGIRLFVEDLQRTKKYIAWSAVLFFGGLLFGYSSNLLDTYLLSQMEALSNTAARMEQRDNPQLWFFIFIFLNNFIKSIAVVFLGALLSVIPIFFLIFNGMLIGYVVSFAGSMGGNVFDLVVKGLLPHGLLEVTAIVIAAGYGIKYGVLIAKKIFRKTREGEAAEELTLFRRSIPRLISFLFFSLITAAFIESTITYFLVRG